MPVEGWWLQGPDSRREQVQVTSAENRSGKYCLRLKPESQNPLSVISALGRQVPQGSVTLTAWVKTKQAKGHLNLGLITTSSQAERHPATGGNSLTLPTNSDWVRLSLTGHATDFDQAIAQITVESGTVFIDDVQIETGTHATPFNVRPAEWLRLEIAGYESNDPSRQRRNQTYLISYPQYTGPFINGLLPKWIQGQSSTQTLTIYNDSRIAFQGRSQIAYGPWNDLQRYKMVRFDMSQLKPGQSRSFPIQTQSLPRGAYVATVRVESQGKMKLDGVKDFHVNQLVGGASSASMLASRQAIRFAVVAKPDPGKIFGVGNSMLFHGGTAFGWWSGFPLKNFAMAGDLGITSTRNQFVNDDTAFLLAAGRLTSQVMTYAVDQQCPPNSSFASPAHPRDVDIFNPKGWAFFKQRAQAIGRILGTNPQVASMQMHNESQYLHKGHLTPSTYADADFRDWCKKRHGTLSTLNQHWGTHYTQWDQVEQIVSARYLQEEKNRPLPKGAAAINWMAVTGGLTPKVLERMNKNPGQAMDWQRWRTDSTLRMYRTFRREARKYDKKTWYGTNLAWPSFWPQMFMRFIRDMDVTMLDVRYTSGFKNSLGTPYEMLDTLEMAESTESSKPIWGSEVYVRPVMPAEFVAMQNWAMVAHGMQNNMVFAWKPYSDHGTPKGTHAWEKPNAPRMWFMIDNDGTHLPHYDTYVRSMREIIRYHKRYNGHSIKRIKTDIAFYVSPDTNEYVTLSTGNKPWNSPAPRTRNLLNYALRHEGISVNYVDDVSLPDTPGKYQTVIVPSSYVLSQKAAQRLADFTRQGGTLVLAGVSGQVDPWLKPYANVGGPAWAELQWETQNDTPTPTPVLGSKTLFQGAGYQHISKATKITDTENHTLGWRRPWGKGTLIAYDVFPVQYTTNPHLPPAVTQWTRQIIKLAKLQYVGRFVTDQPEMGKGHVGTGVPVVEVVVRVKSEKEKFIFCMNQGGAGSGTIQIPLASGNWQAMDVISGHMIDKAIWGNGTWQLEVDMKPWESRVIRLFR